MDRRNLLWGTGALALLAALPRRLYAAATGYPRLLDGPMVGATTPGSFTIWSRASGAFDVAVEYATRRDFSRPTASSPACRSRP